MNLSRNRQIHLKKNIVSLKKINKNYIKIYKRYIYLKFKIILLKITYPPRNKVNLEIFFSNIIISIIGSNGTLFCASNLSFQKECRIVEIFAQEFAKMTKLFATMELCKNGISPSGFARKFLRYYHRNWVKDFLASAMIG